MQENGLRLNPDKMEVLRVGAHTVGGLGNSLSFGGVTLPTKDGVHSLGIHLDLALTMETQVALVVRTAFFHLRRIAQLRPYLDVGVLTTLVHALVISRLDHCNALFMGLPLRLLRKLQVVQNAAARLLSGVKKTPTHLTHSGRIALVAHPVPHRLQSVDAYVQSSKRFRASIPG